VPLFQDIRKVDGYTLTSIMSTDIFFVEPHSSLNEITKFMNEKKCSCLMVVENKKPVGIITERDIVRFLSKRLNNSLTELQLNSLPLATDLMTCNLITLQQEQSIFDALVVSTTNKVRHIPVIDQNGELSGLVTYSDIAHVQRTILESQAAIIESSIIERTSELEEANRLLKEMTLLDPLLGIGNRRAMEIDIKCTHDLSQRYEENYAIAMIDIDNFKLYNDHYGHQAGDAALQKVTSCIKSTIRSSDRVYRYGGEEFLVLLPKEKLEGAKILAQRILSALELEKIPHSKSSFNIVTISCGLGVYNSKSVHEKENSWEHIIRTADKALYIAKNSGRNQVAIDEKNVA